MSSDRLQVILPAGVGAKLDALCEQMGMPRRYVLSRLINEWPELDAVRVAALRKVAKVEPVATKPADPNGWTEEDYHNAYEELRALQVEQAQLNGMAPKFVRPKREKLPKYLENTRKGLADFKQMLEEQHQRFMSSPMPEWPE